MDEIELLTSSKHALGVVWATAHPAYAKAVIVASPQIIMHVQFDCEKDCGYRSNLMEVEWCDLDCRGAFQCPQCKRYYNVSPVVTLTGGIKPTEKE